MGKIKSIGFSIGIILLILSAVFLYRGLHGLSSAPDASAYEDAGVHTFVPYDIVPVQVENRGTRRDRRKHPTKIIYKVYYHTTDGSGYRWSAEGGSVRELAENLYDRGPVDRRVLSIPADNTYITVEASQNAESYTRSLRKTYMIYVTAAGTYMVCYGAAWCVIIGRKKRRQHPENDMQL